jgi:hypothetical protein
MKPARPARMLRAAVILVLATLAGGIVAAPAQAAAFRFWGYFQLANGAWVFAQTGPGQAVPADGSVEGWRFAIADESSTRAPRTTPTFDALCAGTPVAAGTKRVGLVIDYGRAADSADGAAPPAPRAACVAVPVKATGSDVLAAGATLRLDKALTCAIDAGRPPDAARASTRCQRRRPARTPALRSLPPRPVPRPAEPPSPRTTARRARASWPWAQPRSSWSPFSGSRRGGGAATPRTAERAGTDVIHAVHDSRLPRLLHPAAWWAWAIGLAVAASRTTNPLLLALVVAVAGYVVAARRELGAPSPFGAFLRLGLLVISLRVLLQALLGVVCRGTPCSSPCPRCRCHRARVACAWAVR